MYFNAEKLGEGFNRTWKTRRFGYGFNDAKSTLMWFDKNDKCVGAVEVREESLNQMMLIRVGHLTEASLRCKCDDGQLCTVQLRKITF